MQANWGKTNAQAVAAGNGCLLESRPYMAAQLFAATDVDNSGYIESGETTAATISRLDTGGAGFR
jgi:hypothetical protein